MSEELKPCPFCGDGQIFVVEGATFRWRTGECNRCGARCGQVRIRTVDPLPSRDEIRDLVWEEWNKRYDPNPWRYPSRGELPKQGTVKMVTLTNGIVDTGYFNYQGKWLVGDSYTNIRAWKELDEPAPKLEAEETGK